MARVGDGRLRIHRVYKCSAKANEQPYELYLRHNLALQEFSTYFEVFNSGTASQQLHQGDAVFLPGLRDILPCKDCKIVPSQVRKQIQKRETFFEPKTLVPGVDILYECEAGTDPEFDVVFIHGPRPSAGIGSDWLRTWATRRGDKVECWPQKWLPKVFPKARVLALSYKTLATIVESNYMVLWESAIESVKSLLLSSSFGQRPYFLVGHSMGGLLAKEILLRDKQIVKHCKGLGFYGVPHRGAKAANFVTLINTVTYVASGISCPVAEELQLFANRCFQRNLDFEPFMDRIPAFNFLESRKTLCGKIFGVLPVKVARLPMNHGDAVISIQVFHGHGVCVHGCLCCRLVLQL
eukprot:TRINITY_DN1991_c0_g1_i2.p1 TRINITY_DN1991_c0_g1~~TRINITY_DN1991_c0_g1_i2.p1  ORF type:complete len:409 (-),score=48.83 TRINITY_DN1991_c0_g1_i2:67-1122(-)